MSPSSSPWPAYRQLADELRAQIESGHPPRGELLPSESELVHRHGVSRDTVREALGLLRTWGLVAPRQGVGVRVRDLPTLEPVQIHEAVDVSARMPTAAEQERWGLDDGVPVLVVERGDQIDVYAADRTVLRL